MDVTSPQYYDFWIGLFSETTYDDRDAARISATSRMFREIVRTHALVRVYAPLGPCRNPDHGYRPLDEFERWHHANAGSRAEGLPECSWCLEYQRSVAHPRTSAIIDMATERHGLAAAVVGMSRISAVGNSCVADVAAIPRSATALRFGDNFDEHVFSSDLPDGLRDLAFGARFNRRVDERGLPPALTSLELGSSFDGWCSVADLPRGLITLTFGANHCRPIDAASLPPLLEHLTAPRACVSSDDRRLLESRRVRVSHA